MRAGGTISGTPAKAPHLDLLSFAPLKTTVRYDPLDGRRRDARLREGHIIRGGVCRNSVRPGIACDASSVGPAKLAAEATRL